MQSKKIIIPAIAVGCLIVGLTAGFIAGKNSSKVLVESEPYHMEAADYSIGVSKEAFDGIDEPDETEAPVSTSAPVTTPKPTTSPTNVSTGGGTSGSSTTPESSIGTETESKPGTDEEGGNTNPGGSTTYKEYIGMSAEEKQAIAGQFSSPDEYFNWVDSLAQANADAEAEHTYSGSVNIDETFGNN